jgi:tetratricopeptide (TPR) repeat protein
MSQALETWKEQLEHLLNEEAIVVDGLQKFALEKQIKKAQARIAELESIAHNRPNSSPDSLDRDISRIIKYAPAELIGREVATKLLDDAWDQACGRVAGVERSEPPAESASTTGGSRGSTPATHSNRRPHVLTFVALGGEGKTSLVAKWAAGLAHQDWPGCDAVFAWSFYSQGTREQVAASSDLFLREALTFFGDAAMADSAEGAHDKGRRLAQLVGERRTLLILDGLEPLQYAPTSPTPGELRDQGVTALLSGLAASSHGLCVVTTRYSIPNLKAFWQTTAPEEKLLRLSREHGVHLLQTLGVRQESGTAKEFETLVEDVKGHALTLHIMGGFLKRAHRGDIRRRDLVNFEKADEKIDGGHAFRAMDAYVHWMTSDSPESQRELAILRLLGLFDRPATADCIDALLKAPAIPGLTEALADVAEDDWTFSLDALESAKLLTVTRAASGELLGLDTHPHIREYFARELRRMGTPARRDSADGQECPSYETTEAWRAGHRRLYEHLCASTQEGDQPTLEALQPLYQAVAHGCHAGLQQEALDKVYVARINKGMGSDGFYSTKKLGAFGSDLGAVACFFANPWSDIATSLIEPAQAFLLNQAAYHLRALGRLTEALELMRAALEMGVKQENWKSAATRASNLSELELTLGKVAEAAGDAEQSVTYADRSGDASQRGFNRETLGDTLHQAGRRVEAEMRFREAEQMQAESQPDYPLLYSTGGFRYCDLLLAAPERAAWQSVAFRSAKEAPDRCFRGAKGDTEDRLDGSHSLPDCIAACRAVSQRAAQTLKWMTGKLGPLDIALDHLTLGRAALYAAVLAKSETRIKEGAGAEAGGSNPKSEIEQAVSGLRRAGHQGYLPLALLTCVWQRFLTGAHTGPESAQSDLDEAWEIAVRGPMPLFMADVHLHRARLFGTPLPASPQEGEEQVEYPWESPATDLAAAEKLINDCGYHRRDDELADAKAAILA